MAILYLTLFIVLTTSVVTFSQIDKLKEHLKEGEFEEVIDELDNKAIIKDLSDEELFLYAKAKLGLLELDEAQEILEALIKKDPENPAYKTALAEIHLQRGELKRAEETLMGVSDNPAKLYILGTIAILKGHRDLARSFYTRIPPDSDHYPDAQGVARSSKTLLAELTLSGGYDSNPTIAPQTGFISRRESPSYQLSGSLFYNGWRTSASLDLSYTTYDRAKDFNTFRGSLSGEVTFGKIFIPFTVDYITLGGEFYRVTGETGVGYFLGKIKAQLLAGYHDYYKTPIKEENRDGGRYSARLEYPFNLGKVVARASITGGYEDTRGENWKSLFLQPSLLAGYERGRFSVTVNVSAGYYSFQRKNTIYGKRREDIFLVFEPTLRVRLVRFIVAEARYSFNQNSSTISDLSYIRHVIYAGVGGVF